MAALLHQRCLNHSQREAVARCPECRQFFCRECITEHDERVICAACLRKLAQSSTAGRRGFAGFRLAVQCLAGLALAWFFFYLVGESLLALPSSFHEGTLWQNGWMDSP